MVDRIKISYLKECARPRHLILTGHGGAMMYDVKSVTLRFLSYDALNVSEARVLYVEMAEEFLQRINDHEAIRPHLHDFPFGIDNIKLSIGFEDNQKRITQDGNVALMFIGRNHTVYYEACDPKTEDFYCLHKEPYEEALKLVKGSSRLDPSHRQLTPED